jgi:hypothetical protein
MKNKLWKLYIIFFSLGALYTLFTDNIFNGLFDLFGMYGLYCYVNKIKFWNPVGWSIVIILSLVSFGFNLIPSIIAGIDQDLRTQLYLVGAILIGLTLNIPYFYGLIKYCSRKNPVWQS